MIAPTTPPEPTCCWMTACRCRWRAAFTLVEVLVVLVLLLTILAVARPSIARLYRRHQLRQSAMLVQSHVSAARLNSIERSHSYAFWYELGGRRYRVAPSQDSVTFARRSHGPTDSTAELPSFSGTLPRVVSFSTRRQDLAAGNSGRGKADRSGPRAASSSTGHWSEPVVFYPDGTARNAEIVLSDDENHTMRIVVRGLIGTVRLESGRAP